MSQRSHAATSGSSPIDACSAACAAPARSTPRLARASRWPGEIVHHTARVRSVRGAATSAWAVGQSGQGANATSLIQHWDGTSWTVTPNLGPGTTAVSRGVTATSATSAWAVGQVMTSSGDSTLIQHWDGTSWTAVPSPNTSAPDNILESAAATSAADAWAVGFTFTSISLPTGNLIEHWNGASWAIVPCPAGTGLFSVTATSATNAWAVGDDTNQNLQILHWNGTSWLAVPSPAPSMFSGTVPSVTATSATSAWLAGSTFVNGNPVPFTEHWDGTAWTVVPSVNANGESEVHGVSATSASNAWIVGDTLPSPTQAVTLTEHWNGTAWAVRPSPSPGVFTSFLSSVDAVSASNAWAVGRTELSNGEATLIEHWNGSAWTVTPSP